VLGVCMWWVYIYIYAWAEDFLRMIKSNQLAV
jgi:hypothetical protein